MKKIFKYSCVCLLSVIVLGLASCTDSYNYDEAPAYTGGEAYLVADTTTFTLQPEDVQSFTFHVDRNDASKAETVNLKSDNTNFSIPSSVDFAAGEKSKTVTATFNMAIGSSDTVTVSIDSTQAYTYAPSYKRFIITRDYVWEDLGKGTFTSELYEDTWQVEVLHAKDTGIYRAKDLYETGHDIDIVVDGSSATVAQQYAWTSSTYGEVDVLTLSPSQYPDYASTFSDGVLTLYLYHYVPSAGGGFGVFKEVLELP